MNEESYMEKCISLAKLSEKKDEVPVGAILVFENKILFESHNSPVEKKDPTALAEINVIRSACNEENNYRLKNYNLYTTLEPCIMCIGAICEARIEKVFFGAYATNKENFLNKIKFYKRNNYIDHLPKFTGGILEKECSSIIKNFFKRKRG